MPETSRRSLAVYESPRDLRLRAWVRLARTHALVQRRIVSELHALDLTLPQFDVLATLRFNEGVTQQELAGRLLVTKGNVCGVIDRLESLKWVERRPDPADRRANRLHLTSQGKKKIDTVLPKHDDLVAGLLDALPNAQLSALRSALEALEHSMNDRE